MEKNRSNLSVCGGVTSVFSKYNTCSSSNFILLLFYWQSANFKILISKVQEF